MICTIAIQGYRSLRQLVLPLGQLTVITGANGSGKSSVYRSLRLLADAAQNAVIADWAVIPNGISFLPKSSFVLSFPSLQKIFIQSMMGI